MTDSRRNFLKKSAWTTAALPFLPVGCSKERMLTLEFLTIPDPDGWHPSLRLKGDWLVFKISDGVHAGYGEASHSKRDDICKEVAKGLFRERVASFDLSLESLSELEEELAASLPDFVAATAWSGINQALYDLLAKREQVPVWRLFKDKTSLDRLGLYTTINRSLTTRTLDDYLQLVGQVETQGFKFYKCAPFEKVVDKFNTEKTSKYGLDTLSSIRRAFPELNVRVDFHERFSPENFYKIIPDLEALEIDWIEEPFAMGPEYTELRQKTSLKIAAGELYWGSENFRAIMESQWADVIMPDVKHVGGFGPLLRVIEMGKGKIEVSPHNPSGPVSTAASLHAAALYPENVKSLEYAFDAGRTRKAYGERVEDGNLYLSDKPGWGINVEN